VNAIAVNFSPTVHHQYNSFYVGALYVLRPLLFRSAVCSRKIEIVVVIVVPSHGLEPRTYWLQISKEQIHFFLLCRIL